MIDKIDSDSDDDTPFCEVLEPTDHCRMVISRENYGSLARGRHEGSLVHSRYAKKDIEKAPTVSHKINDTSG